MEFIENLKRTSCKNCQQFFCFKYRELPRTASIFRRMHTKCMFLSSSKKEVLPRQNECVCKSKGWTYGKAGYMFRKDIYK